MTQQELLRDFTAEFKRRDVLVALNARQHTDEEGAHIEKELLRTQGRLAVLSSDPRLPVAELASALEIGLGWDNPTLPLYLIEDPLLSSHLRPSHMLRGLSAFRGVEPPFMKLVKQFTYSLSIGMHPSAADYRNMHSPPEDSHFALYGGLEPLARCLYVAWLAEPVTE